jgi:uncharacterized protein YggE
VISSPSQAARAPRLRHGVVALAVMVVAGSPAFGQTLPEPPPSVVTTGEAIVKVAPDRAFVTVQAESRARNPKDAQKENADAMNAVMQKLRSARLPADAIRTLSFNLQPEFDYRDGKQTLRGYLASNTIEVRLDDITRVGEIVDLSVGSGATSVGGVRFDLKERDAVERQALRQAVADARARADAAAAGAGQSIVRVLRIEEQRTTFQPPRPMAMMRMEAQADAAPTPVAPGEIEIRANVVLTAQLK